MLKEMSPAYELAEMRPMYSAVPAVNTPLFLTGIQSQTSILVLKTW